MSSASKPTAPWQSQLRSQAAMGIARGWAYTPLKGKIPQLSAWQQGPPATLEEVSRWVQSGLNLGLRTGQVSGVVVVDDDSVDGSASAALELPPTVTAITGSGRLHFYFKAPEDAEIRNSNKTVAAGIDIKGDRGQVVAVGSIHPETGREYRWKPGCSPEERDLADLPAWLLEKTAGEPSDLPPESAEPGVLSSFPVVPALSGSTRDRVEAYVQSAVKSELEKARVASEGQRNDTLNKAAFALGQFVAAGELDEAAARASLADAADSVGLPSAEALATIGSGLSAGMRNPRDLGVLREQELVIKKVEGLQRPEIKVVPGRIHETVDRAEKILMTCEPVEFFQRGTTLVRVAIIPERGDGRTIAHRPTIVTATQTFLVDRMTALIDWKVFDSRTNDWVRRNCPSGVARTLLSRAGRWRLPTLIGIIDAPTLRGDGSILDTAGYDEESGIFYAPGDEEFPRVPASPDQSAAEVALARLLEVIKDFDFMTEEDRSVALAAILTSAIRPSLPTAPLFAFRAAKMGSGKSLLADVVALICTGRHASVMTQGTDDNEDKKRMLPILAEGQPVACIDNIERPFGSDALCSILTQRTWRDRVLGKSETLSLPTTNTLWIATGNNIAFAGDITTRVVVCDLDPKSERPEERQFDVDLHRFIPEHRGELLVAALTVLRAYHVAGRPAQQLPNFGRFEVWSSWVRSALVWLGLPDPCLTRRRVEDFDPVRQQIRALLVLLSKAFDRSEFKAADVLAHAQGDEGFGKELADLIPDHGEKELDSRRLGTAFQRIQRRIEGGLRLLRVRALGGVAVWRIDHV